jgi:hypothetical protein
LRELKADGGRVGHEFLVNLALGQVERAIRRWRAKNPKSRFSLLRLERRGRPPLLDGDVEDLRALRAADPDSDGQAKFKKQTGVGKQRARIRYQAAAKRIAKTTSKPVRRT